ncbi:MAG: hypothetical protein Q7V01_14390 [Vicinamibacterales bacterium]|nr:hypothetical protein [Vicinamibacterales bacterium]
MTRPRRALLVAGVVLGMCAAALAIALTVVHRARSGSRTSSQLRAEVAVLQSERNNLQARRDELAARDSQFTDLPQTPVKVGIPTHLARDLITKVLTGFADQASIELRNLSALKTGTITKVVTLGDYRLRVNADRVSARLKPGPARVTFGGDGVAIALPVSVTSGSGHATVRLTWNGRNVAGVVCGDMEIARNVTATVIPATYSLAGRLSLQATATQIVIAPKIPPLRIHVRFKPSDESWAAVQQILDDKRGVCGFVLDRVDVMGAVRDAIGRGFHVTLPLDRIPPMALPVGIQPELDVKGRKLALKVHVGTLAITKDMIWLGVNVAVAPQATGTAR